ncbi:MAG: FeoB-associated Cys-rich membrane protein [Clostridiales bacterium]|nr:FeoB-associated Cys-rich membrane protein [Clostridiales bacterium]
MKEWITDNIGNIVVIGIVVVIVALALMSIIRDRKSGKNSCGCNCAGCALKDSCHSKK